MAKSDAVTIALSTTWAGWKMLNSTSAWSVPTFLNMSMKSIPVKAPSMVNGAWPLSSAPICNIFSFIDISFSPARQVVLNVTYTLYVNATELQEEF